VKDFGKRFRQWRETRKVSGWAIEKAIGLSRSNISSMEAGRYIPSDEVLQDIASIPELKLPFVRLRAWKALDDYTLEELEAALMEGKKMGWNNVARHREGDP
jgi:transcriptional regulator with XRE-family HTH domain